MFRAGSRLEKIGPLEALVSQGSPDAPCIVIFHGFGADAYDLAPLSGEIAAPEGSTWVFPNAPLKVPIAPGFMGRAWFPIRLADLQASTGMDFSELYHPELAASRQAAIEMLETLQLGDRPLFLGGFSQGAMLATELALHLDRAVEGVFIFSGALLDRKNWQELALKKKGQRFFQSHGLNDPVLPIRGGRQLEGLLKASGWKGNLMTFPGGHEIPYEVLSAASGFFNHKLS